MFAFLLKPLARLVKRCVAFIQERVNTWTTPASSGPVVGALVIWCERNQNWSPKMPYCGSS
jgi:hypothetical protein